MTAGGGIVAGRTVADRYEVRGQGPSFCGHRELEAFDTDAEVEVALWILDPELFSAAEFSNSPIRDAQALNHPGIRRIFSMGVFEDHCFVAVETAAVAGTEALAAEGLDLSGRLVRQVGALASALTAGHKQGLVHGRLVPSDVVSVAGTIKVGGLGLFSQLDPVIAARKWQPQSRYLAPEVLESGRASVRSDVYSMAALIAEAACGGPRADLSDAIEELAGDYLGLADLLSQSLTSDPDRRPESPQQFSEQLARVFVDHKGETVPRDFAIPPEAIRDVTLPSTDMPNMDDLDEMAIATVEQDSPLFLDPSAAPRSPLFGPNQATVMGKKSGGEAPPPSHGHGSDGFDDPGRRGPDQETVNVVQHDLAAEQQTPLERPRGEGPRVVPMHSRRMSEPPSEKRPTPRVPAIDRPDLQPVLRPLSSVRRLSAPPGALGNYAPPRKPGAVAESVEHRAIWPWFAIAVALSVAAVILAVLLTRDSKSAAPAMDAGALGASSATGASSASGDTDAPAASPPVVQALSTDLCPPGMLLVEASAKLAGYCMDQYEVPGQGQTPTVGVAFEQAENVCSDRGGRLCSPDEWEAGCRGQGRASFPYGPRYKVDACNVRNSKLEESGSRSQCQSGAGLFDMSGNAAEWDGDGRVRGGSATDGASGRCSDARKKSFKDYSDVGVRCCAELLAPVGPDR